MWTIRDEQADALRKAAVKNFEDRSIVHVTKYFPTEFAKLGQVRMREMVRYGVERAKSYGIVAERDVCKYVDLMLLFGRDFDLDLSLHWPQAILIGSELDDPTEIANDLYEQGMASLEK
jgi:hypothetical protein